MLSFEVIITQKDFGGQNPVAWWRTFEQDFHWELQNQLNFMKEDAHQFMREIIKSKIKRVGSTGNLANSIQAEFWKAGNDCGFWIGDVDYLNANAKYWHWLNYGVAQTGRKIPPPNYGYFGQGEAPHLHGQGQAWTHTGDKGDYLMIPWQAIEPMDYIDTTILKVDTEIPELLANLEHLIEERG
jgi:hypothetical protein